MTNDQENAARECAIEVLKNCAAHYAKPEWFRAQLGNFDIKEQEFIDRAITNATKIISTYANRTLREELADIRDRMEAATDNFVVERKRAESAEAALCAREGRLR